MAVKVCDAIMGSGKSSAVIAYMNCNPNKRYLYITPYLDEAKRIRDHCPELEFVEPSNKLKEYNFSKYVHLASLLAAGRNIASTHQMFRHLKPELLGLVRSGHYTLIVDEAVDVFQELRLKDSDFEIANRVGWIDEAGNSLISEETPDYQGDRLKDVFDLAKNGNLVNLLEGDKTRQEKEMYYWVMSPGFFKAFDDVFILTYLFSAQTLKYYFDMNHIDFEYIGVKHPRDGEYFFTDGRGYIPAYTASLSEKIHILDREKLNGIGASKTALSANWFRRRKKGGGNELEVLRRHLQNYYTNICKDIPAEERMWSTYKEMFGILRGKGFYNSSLAYNSRATNAYRNKRALAYCVNIFMNPEVKRYFLANGADVREDEEALSTMVQWIWRSAIRDGREIWIYIPSRRMRELLQKWIGDVEESYRRYKESIV